MQSIQNIILQGVSVGRKCMAATQEKIKRLLVELLITLTTSNVKIQNRLFC